MVIILLPFVSEYYGTSSTGSTQDACNVGGHCPRIAPGKQLWRCVDKLHWLMGRGKKTLWSDSGWWIKWTLVLMHAIIRIVCYQSWFRVSSDFTLTPLLCTGSSCTPWRMARAPAFYAHNTSSITGYDNLFLQYSKTGLVIFLSD